MRHTGYPKQERNFITLMHAWVVIFLGLALLFATIPSILLKYINDLGKVFLNWHSPAIAAGGDIWRVQAVVLNVCLAYVSAIAQGSALRNIAYARIVLLASFACAAGSTGMIFLDGPHFYYLISAISYGIVFLVTLWFYSSSARSRN